MTILTSRRRFLAGLFAAPAIIPAASLMKVRAIVVPKRKLLGHFRGIPIYEFASLGNDYESYVSHFGSMNSVLGDVRWIPKA